MGGYTRWEILRAVWTALVFAAMLCAILAVLCVMPVSPR